MTEQKADSKTINESALMSLYMTCVLVMRAKLDLARQGINLVPEVLLKQRGSCHHEAARRKDL